MCVCVCEFDLISKKKMHESYNEEKNAPGLSCNASMQRRPEGIVRKGFFSLHPDFYIQQLRENVKHLNRTSCQF